MIKAHYLYSELAQAVQARKACQVSGNTEWFDKWTEKIKLIEGLLPHGSGFDSGTKVNLEASHSDKLVFETSFHHMTDSGFYDGWTEHTVTVIPAFIGDYHIRVSGRNVNDIKEYIGEEFEHLLHLDITYELFLEQFPQFRIVHKWENSDGSESQCYQAYYVNAERFWNDYQSARNRASELMIDEFHKPKGAN